MNETRIGEINGCCYCRDGIWIFKDIYHCKKTIKTIYDNERVESMMRGIEDTLIEEGLTCLPRSLYCPLSTKSQYIQQQIKEAL